MPIPLGVLAVAGAGAGPSAAGAFELLESQILTGTQASVTFSNLNTNYGSTYQHLQLRMVVRGNRNATEANSRVEFNGDTGTNYRAHALIGNGSTVTSYDSTARAYIYWGDAAGLTFTANGFAAAIMDILDPFETTKNTTTRTLSGLEGNYDRIQLFSGFWNNTAALTSIRIFPEANDFITGSRFSLYGMRSS
jgi:hypothetical protein